MKEIWDFFDEHYDYPNHANCAFPENGVPQNTVFCYVSSSFLDGFINYVTINKAVMINRYRNDDQDYTKVIEQFNNNHHSIIGKLPDDVLIAAHTDNSHWFFWYDKDSSDCVIGRFDSDKCDRDEFLESFDFTIKNHEYFKSEPTEIKLKGWISN